MHSPFAQMALEQQQEEEEEEEGAPEELPEFELETAPTSEYGRECHLHPSPPYLGVSRRRSCRVEKTTPILHSLSDI